MNLPKWKKKQLLPPFFSPGIQGIVYWQLRQKRGSCTPLKSKCLFLQQVIPFKWGASHFSWQNTVAQHLETSSEHREPLSSCRTRSFPATDRSPQTCWQHLLSSTWDYSQPPMSCIWHTIFHQENSLARAFKGSTFTLQQVLKQRDFWNKRPYIWVIVLYCFLFTVLLIIDAANTWVCSLFHSASSSLI